jgi:nucleoside-diphosphate-sugar epimerase
VASPGPLLLAMATTRVSTSLIHARLVSANCNDRALRVLPSSVTSTLFIDTLTHNIAAIANQAEQTGIINIGNGKPTSVSNFINAILKIKNSDIKLNKGHYPYASYEPHEFYADITKLKSVAGVKFDDSLWL